MRLPPFSALDWLTWSAEQAAQVAVLVTALRLPKPRPHAPLFAFVLASDAYMRAVEWLYLERVAVPGVPPAGAARALYHTVQALSTAWPAAVAALAWWVYGGPQKTNGPELPEPPREGSGPTSTAPSRIFQRALNHAELAALPPYARRSGSTSSYRNALSLRILPLAVKAIFCLWLAFNAAMCAAFPLPRGWTQPALHAFAGLCVLLGSVAIVTGWTRRHERAAQVAGYLVVVEGAVCIVGPWAGNVFAQWRTVGAGMYAVAFSLLAAWQWYQSPRP